MTRRNSRKADAVTPAGSVQDEPVLSFGSVNDEKGMSGASDDSDAQAESTETTLQAFTGLEGTPNTNPTPVFPEGFRFTWDKTVDAKKSGFVGKFRADVALGDLPWKTLFRAMNQGLTIILDRAPAGAKDLGEFEAKMNKTWKGLLTGETIYSKRGGRSLKDTFDTDVAVEWHGQVSIKLLERAKLGDHEAKIKTLALRKAMAVLGISEIPKVEDKDGRKRLMSELGKAVAALIASPQYGPAIKAEADERRVKLAALASQQGAGTAPDDDLNF